MKDYTVWGIVNTLTENQKKQFYYVIGCVLDNGKSPRRRTDYKILVKTLNEDQKKCLDWLIDKAIKDYKEKEDERS